MGLQNYFQPWGKKKKIIICINQLSTYIPFTFLNISEFNYAKNNIVDIDAIKDMKTNWG